VTIAGERLSTRSGKNVPVRRLTLKLSRLLSPEGPRAVSPPARRPKDGDMSEVVAIAQIVTAIATVFYAGVFAIGYYMLIKGNRQTLSEMREQRISGGRPQVIVQGRYDRLPMVDLVVRNLGGPPPRGVIMAPSATDASPRSA
jgi:hypothetical protein